MDGLMEVLTPLITVIVTAVLGYISTAVVKFINSKTEALKESAKNDAVSHSLDVASTIITDTVVAMQNTVVDELKAASADGKLTKDEILEIQEKALATVRAALSDDTIDKLSASVGDLDTFIMNAIESQVKKLRDAQ